MDNPTNVVLGALSSLSLVVAILFPFVVVARGDTFVLIDSDDVDNVGIDSVLGAGVGGAVGATGGEVGRAAGVGITVSLSQSGFIPQLFKRFSNQ